MPLQDANPTPSFGGFGLSHTSLELYGGRVQRGYSLVTRHVTSVILNGVKILGMPGAPEWLT